jgi:tight adherence protein B
LIGAALIALFVLIVWLFRRQLQSASWAHPAFFPAIALASATLVVVLSLILWVEAGTMRRVWKARTAEVSQLPALEPEPIILWLMRRIPDPLEWLAKPVWRTTWGLALFEEWQDAELGGKPSRYLLLLIAAAIAGGFIGNRIGGVLLGFALAFILPILPRTLIRNRAQTYRRRFGEQLPQALDSFASGLSAGLSFEQAIRFAQEDLPSPIREAFAKLSRRISLGHPIDEALRKLLSEHPDESLALALDGLILQRQFGGDMVRMLEESADLLRGRVELEREVRAVTTQGRLTGTVIAALVPVSAGILLAFNPRYIDVLFDTLIGQLLVVVAFVLQLIGWAIISRMVRIRY